MIKIKKVNIKRFRSILDLDTEIDPRNNFVTICGENNSGKTNTLRAIDVFMHPEKYNPEIDSPNHKFFGSRGSKSFPEIIIDFALEDGNIYRVTRKFDIDPCKVSEETIIKLKVKGVNDKNTKLENDEIKKLLNKINFFFIESINISFPELINNLIDDIYDLEYEKTKFTGLKNELKKSYEEYSNGLLLVLKTLSNDINPIFKEFNDRWSVEFDFASNIKKFRDLINNDILFYINDKSNKNIEGKGSGLQRLAYILLHLKIIAKSNKKTSIVLLDEPDIFLHQGLQKKLYSQLKAIADKNQVFITTHSPTFIDSYTLSNVFFELPPFLGQR